MEGAAYCVICAAPVAYYAAPVAYYAAMPHPYQKVGGWLKFQVVVPVINLFFLVVGLFSSTGFLRSWRGYAGAVFWLQLLIQLCTLYGTAIMLSVAVMILQRDPRFVRTWQLIFFGSFSSAVARLALHLLDGYPAKRSFAYGLTVDILTLVMAPLVILFWTTYYAKSVRVRTYMGSDKYLRLAFFTKKIPGPMPVVPDPDE